MSVSAIDNLSNKAKVTWAEVVGLWRRHGLRDIAIDLTSDLPTGTRLGNFRKHPKRLAYRELEVQGLIQIEELTINAELSIIAGWTFTVHPTKLAIELVKVK